VGKCFTGSRRTETVTVVLFLTSFFLYFFSLLDLSSFSTTRAPRGREAAIFALQHTAIMNHLGFFLGGGGSAS